MAWKQGKYYQRSVRINGRVTTEYGGVGVLGQWYAEQDEQRRQLVQADRDETRRHREAYRAEGTLGRRLTALVELALNAAGYARHDRGEWRRRAMSG
jgi:hypothetical protein